MTGGGPFSRGHDLAVEPLFVGVVTSGDEVVWLEIASSREELLQLLCIHLLPASEYMLPDIPARHFRELVAQTKWEPAVTLYFGEVGKRWEREYLTIVARESRPVT